MHVVYYLHKIPFWVSLSNHGMEVSGFCFVFDELILFNFKTLSKQSQVNCEDHNLICCRILIWMSILSTHWWSINEGVFN